MLLTRVLLAGVLFGATGAAALAAPTPTIVSPQTAKWQQGTGAFTAVQIAPIVGDPSASGGYYAYLIKMPDGVRVPPHFHGMTENVVVLSGTLMVGLGDTIEPTKMLPLGPGSVVSVTAGLHHYAMAQGETIIEVSGMGPDTLTPVGR
jgi:quercetin dioxygenase-like cupin family protein